MLKKKENLLILSLDAYGDLILRQSFFEKCLNYNYQVTIVVRSRYAKIIKILDKRLKYITIQINPYQSYNKNFDAQLFLLIEKIKKRAPTVIIAMSYSGTYVDEWILRNFPNVTKIGFNNCHDLITKLTDVSNDLNAALPLSFQNRLNHFVSVQKSDHEFQKYKILQKFIFKHERLKRPCINYICSNTLHKTRVILKQLHLFSNSYAIFAPAGTENVEIKKIPIHIAQEVIHILKNKYKVPILMIGVKSEKQHLHSIAKKLKTDVKIWIGKESDFYKLIYLIKLSKYFIGADTGVMHLAAALKKPVLGIFGGGTYPRFLPLAKKWVVLKQYLPCYGCNWHCQFDTPLCLTTLSRSSVENAITTLMN